MKQKGNTTVIIIILVVALVAIGFLVIQNMRLKKQVEVVPSSSPSAQMTDQTPSPSPTLMPGWKLYQNSEYNFEFSHPAEYKVLTDSENLYGWPHAILLLYKGGQSYDLAVEIWGSEAEYKANYSDTSDLTVFKTKDGKFVTLLNNNGDPKVAEIISTFKLSK